jgi:hypothetical protein
MNRDLFSATEKRQSILAFPWLDGSHLGRGQREYNPSDLGREAVGANPPIAFSFALSKRTGLTRTNLAVLTRSSLWGLL